MDRERKPEVTGEQKEHVGRPAPRDARPDDDIESRLEDDGRGWCGVRTYITGPQTVGSGKSAEFQSNYYIDSDPGCKSAHIDEVVWTVTDVPSAYQSLIHIQQQDANACVVAVEAGVPSGTHFTLHATPSAHALGRGTSVRVACQINKSDAQIISVS
jgi:hypothetical protein